MNFKKIVEMYDKDGECELNESLIESFYRKTRNIGFNEKIDCGIFSETSDLWEGYLKQVSVLNSFNKQGNTIEFSLKSLGNLTGKSINEFPTELERAYIERFFFMGDNGEIGEYKPLEYREAESFMYCILKNDSPEIFLTDDLYELNDRSVQLPLDFNQIIDNLLKIIDDYDIRSVRITVGKDGNSVRLERLKNKHYSRNREE